MRAFLLLILLTPAVWADDRWIQLRSDGFEMLSDAGEREARETLAWLEQFRHALGKTLGKSEIRTSLPAQVLLFRSAKDAREYLRDGAIQAGRERITILPTAGAPPSREFARELARLFIESNTDRMPESFERGLVALYSTLDVKGTRITLGQPVPPAERTQDWALVHLLSVHEEYYGRLSVLLNNLQKGIDEDAAYRNAFGKPRSEIDRQAASYLAAGNFATVGVSGRPLSPERDFPERELAPDEVQKRLASLAQESQARSEYDALVQSAKTGKDKEKAVADLRRAIELQPRRPEPHLLLARLEPDLKKRVELLKKAVELDRRDASLWQALAEAHIAEHQFVEAAKAWRGAEQAATTSAQRAAMRQARLDIERQRLDFEEAERRRIAEENEREIRKLKEQAIAELRALEARANKDGPAANPDEKVVPWWDGPAASGKVRGMLKQVDCLRGQARLVIEDESQKIVKLLVRDPSSIAIAGATEQTLGCGVQKPRSVTVEYFPKRDAKLATTGEVALIEFR